MSIKEEYHKVTRIYLSITFFGKLLFSVLLNLLTVYIAKYNTNLINSISKEADFISILTLGIPLAVLTLLYIVLNYTLFVGDLYFPRKFYAACRMLFYDKFIYSNPIELNKYNNSTLYNILGSQLNDVINQKYSFIGILLSPLITITVYTINFYSFFPYYFIPVIFIIYFLIVIISKKQIGKISLYVAGNIKKQNEYSLLINELYDNYEEIKSLRIEDKIENKISAYMQSLRELQKEKQRYNITIGVLKSLPNVVVNIFVFLYTYWNIVNQQYDIGSYYLGLSIASAYLGSFSSIFEIYSRFVAIKAAEKPLLSFLDIKDDFKQLEVPAELSEKVLTHLSCNDLNFSYDGNASDVINQINICLDSGYKLILKGPSGCGKTTLLKLLSGLYTPDKGSISYYNGEKKYSPVECRYLFGYHLQNPIMLKDTIKNNITLGKEYSEQEIFDVLKKVKLYDVVMKKVDGLDEQLGYSGAGLSGGEKQRLALARILIKNPSAIFLDESFSAVDDKTSREIFNNIDVPISVFSLHRDDFIDNNLNDKVITFMF